MYFYFQHWASQTFWRRSRQLLVKSLNPSWAIILAFGRHFIFVILQVLAPLWVYGNHVFLAMSYLCFFTEGPLLTVFGYAVGVFKLLLWLSAPWSISRGMINGVMAVEAFRSFARMDVSRRLEQRHTQNGQAVPVQNGVTVTGHDHKDWRRPIVIIFALKLIHHEWRSELAHGDMLRTK